MQFLNIVTKPTRGKIQFPIDSRQDQIDSISQHNCMGRFVFFEVNTDISWVKKIIICGSMGILRLHILVRSMSTDAKLHGEYNATK
jgi:hypothetical protein